MLRVLAVLLMAAASPAFADSVEFEDRSRSGFLPVTPTGPGSFSVARRSGTAGIDYFCRAGEWARAQGAAYTDRVEVVGSGAGGVNFRIVKGGSSSGSIVLSLRPGEKRSVGHALALCGRS